MSIIRPNFAELFRAAAGRKVGGRPDLSASSASESRLTFDSEAAGGFAIEPRASDPPDPLENELWLRFDKEPPELRLFSGGRTYASAFAPAEAEPPVPLVPDVDLAPPLVPEGVDLGPLAPDTNLAPPLVPNR